MKLLKPKGVVADPWKSAKWDELCAGRNFSARDVPTLSLLVQWHAVAQRCIDDIDDAGGRVAYQNDAGDLRSMPQIATMKQASAEIRQLNKQLGIASEAGGDKSSVSEATTLSLVSNRRKERRAEATG